MWFNITFKFLVELGGFLRYRIDISRNFRLVDLGGFSRFQFRV